MKHLRKILSISLISSLFNAGCGVQSTTSDMKQIKQNHAASKLIVKTRQLSWQEIKAKGYAQTPPTNAIPLDRSNKDDSASSLSLSADIVNAITDVVKIIDGKADIMSHSMGHAIPAEGSFVQLSEGEENYVVYNKTVNSILGGTILSVDYKISFRTKNKFKGKGAYIADVTFIPLNVYVDGLYDFKVTSSAGHPVNKGTLTDPVALLKINVTFNLSGFVSRVTTDEFRIHGDKTVIEADVNSF